MRTTPMELSYRDGKYSCFNTCINGTVLCEHFLRLTLHSIASTHGVKTKPVYRISARGSGLIITVVESPARNAEDANNID